MTRGESDSLFEAKQLVWVGLSRVAAPLERQ